MTEPRRITDQYRLDKLVHSSSSGSVFRATELKTGGTVAVKLIAGGDSEEHQGRFLAGVAALQELRHPAVPRVLDFGLTSAGSAFLVTELLQGTSSLESLAGSRPARLLPLLTQVLSGLEALESQGVAHGNLNAGNVVFTAASPGLEDVQVKLLGLGRVVADPAPRRTDLPAFALLACRMLGITPPADPAAPQLQLPSKLEREIGNPERLRTLLEALLQPAQPEESLPAYEEIRQALHDSLSPGADDRTMILPPKVEPPPAVVSPPPPPPPPLPRPAVERTEAIPMPKRRPAWVLPVGAVLLAGILAGAVFLFRKSPEVSSPPPPAATPEPVRPSTPESPSPPEAVQETPEATPATSPAPAEADAGRREALATGLAAALRAGDLRRLRSAVAAFSPEDRNGLAGKAARDLETANRALAAEARLAGVEKSGRKDEILSQAAELAKLLPSSVRAREAREKAAAALEAEAEQAVDAGRFEAALQTLETVRRIWPERDGLGERLRKVQAAQGEDERLEALLAAAEREKATRPHEGLKLLAGASPGPRFADRFRQARAGLEAQFARLDQNPPAVSVLGGLPQVEKGKTLRLVLRVGDDYETVAAELWLRPEGGRYEKVPLRALSASDYEAQVSPDLHHNDAVEIYALATDRSGHTGRLASSDAPLKLKRKGLLKRLLDRSDG